MSLYVCVCFSNATFDCLTFSTVYLFCLLYSMLGCAHVYKQERETDSEEGEEGVEETSTSHLQRLRTTAAKLFQLNQAIRQLHCCLTAALRGETFDIYTSWMFSSNSSCIVKHRDTSLGQKQQKKQYVNSQSHLFVGFVLHYFNF